VELVTGCTPLPARHRKRSVQDVVVMPSYVHESCIHYQLTGGQAIQVDKDEPYDYCTDDADD
jgi:hypothetical protein